MLTRLYVFGPIKQLGVENILICDADLQLSGHLETRLRRTFSEAMPSLVRLIQDQFWEAYDEAMRLPIRRLHVQWASGGRACSLP